MDTKRYTTGKKQWPSKTRWRREPPYEVSYAFDVAVVLALVIAVVAYLLA